MFKKYKIISLGALVIVGTQANGFDFEGDRKRVMAEIGRCPRFEKIAADRYFVAAGVLSLNPSMVANCPALRKVSRSLDRFERCMVNGLSGMVELRGAPSKIGVLKVKAGISKQPYSDDVYQSALGLEYGCKHPELYPEMADRTDL